LRTKKYFTEKKENTYIYIVNILRSIQYILQKHEKRKHLNVI